MEICEFDVRKQAGGVGMENPELCRFYHGRMSRGAANIILQSNGIPPDGTFVVRESTRNDQYVLSLFADGRSRHYEFTNHGDAIFSIDGGPAYQGLEAVIQYYRTEANGLPCKLSSFFQGALPPLDTRRRVDSDLHSAVQNHLPIIQINDIISSGRVDINARTAAGKTALLLAVEAGLDETVKLLLGNGADPKLKDTAGKTPLKVAAYEGHVDVLKTLLSHKDCDVQDRAPYNGWVPMHEAALKGHVPIVKLLLDSGAALNPRTRDNETPRDIALRVNNQDILSVIDFAAANVSEPNSKRSDWLHRSLDRRAATEILKTNGMHDGMFVLRPHSTTAGHYVLTLAHCNADFHYEIRTMNDHWYFIADSPYFSSLEELVDYYSKRKDGIASLLKEGVKPGKDSGLRALRLLAVTGGATCGLPSGDDSFTSLTPSNGSAQQMRAPAGMTLIERQHIVADPAKCKKLGEGGFGSVLLGKWKKDGKGKSVKVAIKTLLMEGAAYGEEEFLREAQVMMSLSHPCIVRFIGVCLADKDGSPMMLVQELVTQGALYSYLKQCAAETNPKKISDMLKSIELWASQIVSGMVYLEKKKFVHRDLATRNILLASMTQCKISDFGLSRAVGNSNYYQATKGGYGPVKWFPPESINYGTFSPASDVWSYGVTLWEMYTFGEEPYGDMSGPEVLHALVEWKHRLGKPLYCPAHAYLLMRKCWSLDPADRPTFSHLYQVFLQQPEYAKIRKKKEFYIGSSEYKATMGRKYSASWLS